MNSGQGLTELLFDLDVAHAYTSNDNYTEVLLSLFFSKM